MHFNPQISLARPVLKNHDTTTAGYARSVCLRDSNTHRMHMTTWAARAAETAQGVWDHSQPTEAEAGPSLPRWDFAFSSTLFELFTTGNNFVITKVIKRNRLRVCRSNMTKPAAPPSAPLFGADRVKEHTFCNAWCYRWHSSSSPGCKTS